MPREYYEQLHVAGAAGQRARGRSSRRSPTCCFRDGFQGVPLFMMISGISLTIAAYRAGDGLRWPRFFFARFRKLLLPYWVGVAHHLRRDRARSPGGRRRSAMGSFSDHFGHGITISLHTIILIDSGVVWASIALVPRLLEDAVVLRAAARALVRRAARAVLPAVPAAVLADAARSASCRSCC